MGDKDSSRDEINFIKSQPLTLTIQRQPFLIRRKAKIYDHSRWPEYIHGLKHDKKMIIKYSPKRRQHLNVKEKS